MPGYELSLIVRSAARPKIVEAVKRAAGQVYENGGFIRYVFFSILNLPPSLKSPSFLNGLQSNRKLECLGEERELPQKQKIHGEWHSKGAFFVLTCDLPTTTIPPILAEMGRDVDVLKKNFVAVGPGPADPPGMLHARKYSQITYTHYVWYTWKLVCSIIRDD